MRGDEFWASLGISVLFAYNTLNRGPSWSYEYMYDVLDVAVVLATSVLGICVWSSVHK